jgi:Na+/proline symporter
MAAFVRGFRALYLGVLFNILIMALVSLAMIKIGAVMLGWSPVQTLVIIMSLTALYSTLGGFRGVLLTDFFQFGIAMAGAVGAAVFLINMLEVGGLAGLTSHPSVIPKLSLLPDFNNRDALVTLLVLPLAVQWWSVWYPGSEPGGGGYIAQRMLASRNEKGSVKATLTFNILHYALRPWPWILVALASLIVFPDLASLQARFPNTDPQFVKHDFAYPAMLSFLPKGFLGLVVASLIAAYMSTISTHLNWGSSYVVHDFYRRFINPDASERKLVLLGRLSTIVLTAVALLFALLLSNALQAFNIVLQIGAGTGLIFILRWFWWRINAYSEITAMIVSFLVALYFQFIHPLTELPAISTSLQLVTGVVVTTVAWVTVTLLTPPAEKQTLREFYRLVRPGGPGWKRVVREAEKDNDPIEEVNPRKWNVPKGILAMVFGCLFVYSVLFATGNWIYSNYWMAAILTGISLICAYILMVFWRRLS